MPHSTPLNTREVETPQRYFPSRDAQAIMLNCYIIKLSSKNVVVDDARREK